MLRPVTHFLPHWALRLVIFAPPYEFLDNHDHDVLHYRFHTCARRFWASETLNPKVTYFRQSFVHWVLIRLHLNSHLYFGRFLFTWYKIIEFQLFRCMFHKANLLHAQFAHMLRVVDIKLFWLT